MREKHKNREPAFSWLKTQEVPKNVGVLFWLYSMTMQGPVR